jgi:tetratricopeptide (TPR) repeat protein
MAPALVESPVTDTTLQAHWDAARAALSARRFEETLQHCLQMLRQDAHIGGAWALMADALYARGDVAEATATLEEANRRVPGDWELVGRLVMMLCTQRRVEAARALVTPFLAPGNPGPLLHLADSCWRTGNYSEAVATYRAATEAAPDAAAPLVSLLKAQLGLGHFAEVEQVLAGAHARRFRHPGLALTRGRLAVDRGEWDAALAHFGEAHRLAPAEPLPAFYLRGTEWFLSGATQLPKGVPQEPGDRLGAKWRSLALYKHAPGRKGAVGIPLRLLARALEAAPRDGLLLEFGVFHGRSANFLAERTERTVHGFDSFVGLPEDWSEAERRGSYSTHGLLPPVRANVRLHPGWFEHTVPPFLAEARQPVALAHIDCDLYSSTRTVLEAMRPFLVEGSVLVFDDYAGYPGFEQHEKRAFEELVATHGLGVEFLAVAYLERELAVRITRC